MTQQLTFEYEIDPKAMYQAMVQTGQNMMRPYRVAATLLYLMSVILAATGGGVLFIAVWSIATGKAPSGLPYPLFGALAGAAFHAFFQQWSFKLMARLASTSSYGRGMQTARFDERGISFSNETATWQTNWAGVEDIGLGKNVFTFRVAAIAFMLPRAVVEDPDDLLQQLRSWKAAA